MTIEKRILIHNPCYRARQTIMPQGIMVHSPCVAQPDPEAFAQLWNQTKVSICTHAIVGTDKVLQFLPWNHRAWHCGKGIRGSGNDSYLSFAICEPEGHTYQGGMMVGYDVQKNSDFFEHVYRNAVEIAAQLCQMYKLNPLTQIICHNEGHRIGIASNHADVMQWFPKHRKNMDMFRQDVAQTLKGDIDMIEKEVQAIVEQTLQVQKYTVWDKLEDVPEWGRETVEKLSERGLLGSIGTGLGITYDLLHRLVSYDCAGLYSV